MYKIFAFNFIFFLSTTIFSFSDTNIKYAPIVNDDILVLVPIVEPLTTKIIGDSSLCLIGSKFFKANVTGSVNPTRDNTTHIWEVTTKPSGSDMLGGQGRYFDAEPDVLGEYTLSLTSTYRATYFGVPVGPTFISTDSKKFTLNDCSGQPITMTVSILFDHGLVWERDNILFKAIPTVRNTEERNVTYIWSVISKPSGSISHFDSSEKTLKYPNLPIDLLGVYTVKVVATVAGINSSDTVTFTADQSY